MLESNRANSQLHHQSVSTVSIVIPCYNASHWIEETLESCVRQTYRSIEIIVIDDGSTDNSAEIANSYLKEGGISFNVISVTNGGASRARNIGLRLATGEWVQFLDADDLLHPLKISLQMQFVVDIEKEVALVYSDWQNLEATSDSEWHRTHTTKPKINDALIDIFKPDSFIATGSQLYHRDWLLAANGFDESIPIVHDVNLLFKLASLGGQFQYCPSNEPLFYYRRHKTSLSQSGQRQFMRDCLNNAEIAANWLRQNSGLTKERIDILKMSYAFIARGSFHSDMETFEIAYKSLKRLSPSSVYIPNRPHLLNFLSRVLGYRNAENIARRYRLAKRFVIHR